MKKLIVINLIILAFIIYSKYADNSYEVTNFSNQITNPIVESCTLKADKKYEEVYLKSKSSELANLKREKIYTECIRKNYR